MKIPGRIHNGVVILEGGKALPEGTRVSVTCKHDVSKKSGRIKRVRFPLVRSKHPGALRLTGKRVAEILSEDDAASRR